MAIDINDAAHPIRALAIKTLEELEEICKANWTGSEWCVREDELVDVLEHMQNEN